ncbi:MAG: DUF3047 domain-containing protein [Gammaproteobacteria bacterium]
MYRFLPLLTLLVVWPTGNAAPELVVVGAFSRGDLSDWEPKKLRGVTDYRLVAIDDRIALKAISEGSASGLLKRIPVDLTRTPILAWSWRVDTIFPGTNERNRAGDDYPARLYVIASGGHFFRRTRAINYVWSSGQPASSAWPNPYTATVIMVAVQSGSESLGEWVAQKRDVRSDFRRYFGQDITAIDGVAIMTDTDNTSGHAVAYYGDIYFEPAAPSESSREGLH